MVLAVCNLIDRNFLMFTFRYALLELSQIPKPSRTFELLPTKSTLLQGYDMKILWPQVCPFHDKNFTFQIVQNGQSEGEL